MPVDAVFIGTVAMATKEAKATDSVKDLLVNTPGITPEDNGGWVARGTGRADVVPEQGVADDLAGVFFFSMQRLACGIERIQHFDGVRKELFAHDGKLRPQPTPVKKTGAGQLFKLVEGFRERRLAQVKSFSRTPQRSLLSDGHNCMQMAQAYALTEQTIFFHRRC